ncbi:DNA-processing protein DprA [Alteromonas lipolytica]|uniref:DNA protecting protein DprA n=1 Tax=Alteromonas lipolytica TaxID=1856405 RepID=A0A1E8FAA3_9ALTE|nr:DNA-processing protein DprA [Alteromonas lipolytica]OFI32852.1 DNA protecting protein DprA [Alteromonas lipolytica]GGF64767.1 DNA processing protein DprA [Alteromonas lipolytica]
MQNQLSTAASQWLLLSQIKKRSPAFWLALLEHFKLTLGELFALSPQELSLCGLKPTEIAQLGNTDVVDRINSWLAAAPHHQIMVIGDTAYPSRLMQLDSPPLVLFCQGDSQLLNAVQIGIVGSRKATLHGLNTARRFGQALGDKGITVTSGLALGIDGAAHQGAYATAGKTVAVLGGGINTIYPRSHSKLAADIVAHGGCVVTEFLPWEEVRPYHFPRRNRLIAALCRGILLVEAKIKSGSMITAALAAELDTEVFAVPGNINNPLSEGPHYLIQQGAGLVTSIDDICYELGLEVLALPGGDEAESDQDTRHPPLLKELSGEAVSIDYLMAKTGMPVHHLMQKLTELEISGKVLAVPGGYILA